MMPTAMIKDFSIDHHRWYGALACLPAARKARAHTKGHSQWPLV
jgi:hypothetical protein